MIDAPSNLQHTPVLLFSGQSDWVVFTAAMVDAQHQLQAFIDPEQIVVAFNTSAAHVRRAPTCTNLHRALPGRNVMAADSRTCLGLRCGPWITEAASVGNAGVSWEITVRAAM